MKRVTFKVSVWCETFCGVVLCADFKLHGVLFRGNLKIIRIGGSVRQLGFWSLWKLGK